ncbi:retrovirus-related pol polyprotein from transposon TNT 1-94 [Tanacetum coccineum]
MTPENKEHFLSEKEAIFFLLTGIGDDIYSTVDACKTVNEMWIAIERLQQGESLNVQDVKTNLFWEFGKFTSRDGESWSRITHVNDIRAERIAKSANPLALLRLLNHIQIITIKHQNLKDIMSTSLLKTSASLPIHKAKRSPNQLHLNLSKFLRKTLILNKLRGKDMQKNWHSFKVISRSSTNLPTTNLQTSSNSRNKTEDTTPRYNNDNQSGQFGNQRTMTVAGTRETVGSPVVQQTRIQCFNCKGFGHYAKECRKPKRVKDYSYHKEKMMMCKQAEQGVPLQAEQADWLADMDE